MTVTWSVVDAGGPARGSMLAKQGGAASTTMLAPSYAVFWPARCANLPRAPAFDRGVPSTTASTAAPLPSKPQTTASGHSRSRPQLLPQCLYHAQPCCAEQVAATQVASVRHTLWTLRGSHLTARPADETLAAHAHVYALLRACKSIQKTTKTTKSTITITPTVCVAVRFADAVVLAERRRHLHARAAIGDVARLPCQLSRLDRRGEAAAGLQTAANQRLDCLPCARIRSATTVRGYIMTD
eukprot:166743-Chlamydomonas_euryale.AAC.2